MTIRQILLEKIEANPFQVRLDEDLEHITRVAASIADIGLLQIPVGRLNPKQEGMVQLAFGHTRLGAFRALRDKAHADPKTERWDYDQMPVDIRDLSDEMLFELAVRENLERKNLSPIEEARAMATYRDSFGKTSAEIGTLFGLGDSAVRNKLRLLDLPPSVQDRVQGHVLPEGVARRILALQHIAPREIETVAESIVTEKAETSEAVTDLVAEVLRKQAFTMGYGSRARAEPGEEEDPTKGRVATGLWPLTWKGSVATPSAGAVLKVLEERDRKVPEVKLSEMITAAASGADVQGVVELFGIVEPAVVLIHQMVSPPPCSACELHQLLDGVHYCGLKACYDQKRKAWIASETRRLSRKLAIPVYDPAADGKAFVHAAIFQAWENDTYQRRLEPHWQKLLDARDESLRLKGTAPEYESHAGTGSYVVELVRVGPAAEKAKAAEKKTREPREQRIDWQAQQREWAQEAKRREATQRFLRQEAAPMFAVSFKGLVSPAVLEALIEALVRDRNWKRGLPEGRAARCGRLRELLAFRVLEALLDHALASRGPVATAKHLTGLAKSLGVKLPADWQDRAEALVPKPASVSTDTESEADDDD